MERLALHQTRADDGGVALVLAPVAAKVRWQGGSVGPQVRAALAAHKATLLARVPRSKRS